MSSKQIRRNSVQVSCVLQSDCHTIQKRIEVDSVTESLEITVRAVQTHRSRQREEVFLNDQPCSITECKNRKLRHNSRYSADRRATIPRSSSAAATCGYNSARRKSQELLHTCWSNAVGQSVSPCGSVRLGTLRFQTQQRQTNETRSASECHQFL